MLRGPIQGGPIQEFISLYLLLKTGQTISYHADDDGDLELGIAHSYTTLTVGQYSGTTTILINGKTHNLSNNCVKDNRTGKIWARYVPFADIGPAADGKLFWEQWTLAAESCTFNAGAKTITAAAGTPFNVSVLCVGRKIDLSETADNNIEITVAAIANNVITTVEDLVNEGPVNTTFATKDDLIWDFLDQANTNNLGGYNDWRIPNCLELSSIIDLGNCGPSIDTVAFPSTVSAYHWSSSTDACDSTLAFRISFYSGAVSGAYKKPARYCVRLVR